MSKQDFEPWQYYMMGWSSAKRPNQKLGFGVSMVTIVLFIACLILLGLFVAACVWYFSS